MRSRTGAVVVLAVSFATFVAFVVVLSGRLQGAALTTALCAGAFVAAVFVAGRPIAAVRALSSRSRVLACAGGLLAMFAAPAIIAGVRMSDAPAGSVVVFWMSGGWAALTSTLAIGVALAHRSMRRAAWALAGGALAVAGAAGVVADWETPSSFSPLVRFPLQEMAILGAGLLLLAGGAMLVRASREGRLNGAPVCASLAALAAAVVWSAFADPLAGIRSLSELPVQTTLAAIAWGVVTVSWPTVLRDHGPAHAAAAISVAPVLVSALTWLEQRVGVAGPQPFIITGVVAGSLVTIAGVVALVLAGGGVDAGKVERPLVVGLAFVPAVLAVAGLVVPAIVARADVSGIAGSFSGSWTLSGAESVAGWSALALALLVPAVVAERGPLAAVIAGLLACAAWPWLAAVPTHVLTSWLSPQIQSYYGTEYGSIAFTAVRNTPALLAVAATAAALVAASAMAVVRRLRPAMDDH